MNLSTIAELRRLLAEAGARYGVGSLGRTVRGIGYDGEPDSDTRALVELRNQADALLDASERLALYLKSHGCCVKLKKEPSE